MPTILRRELQSYFFTPIAYVFTGVFLALSGVLFIAGNLTARSSDILSLLSQMGYLWLLLSPVLTMRLLAGERRQKTDQLLLTSPVSLSAVVVGKYLAACAVLLLAVLLSLSYAALIAIFGTLYIGEALTGYLGFTLQGCAFLAIDLFVSGLSRNPITAAVGAMGANLALWLSTVLSNAITTESVVKALDFISLYKRFEPFSLGQLSLASCVYYLAFIAVMLFLTVRALDARRWSEA